MRGKRSHSRIMPLFHQLPYMAMAQSPRTLKHVLERPVNMPPHDVRHAGLQPPESHRCLNRC